MVLALRKWTVVLGVLFLLSMVSPHESLGETQLRIAYLNPRADAYVHSAMPGVAYGSQDYLWVQSYSLANARTFLVFNLSTLPPGCVVNQASMLIYMFEAPATSRTYTSSRVNGPWSEAGDQSAPALTWEGQPSVDAAFSSTNSSSTLPGWMNWNETYWVQKFLGRDEASYLPNYGWRIIDDIENAPPPNAISARFRSRESSDSIHRPTLIVSYYPPYLRLEAVSQAFVNTWVMMKVHRRDIRGNPISRGVLEVKLSSDSKSANKKFSLTPRGPATNEIVIADGETSKEFWYYDDQPGQWTVRAWTTDYEYYGEDTRWQTFVLDAIPPVTNITVNGPSIQVSGILYVSRNTTFSLSSKDEGSGVNQTKYRVDGGDWQTYSRGLAFGINPHDGNQTIEYYSIDNVGNSEVKRTFRVFMDNTAPSMTISEPTGTLMRKSVSVDFKVIVRDNGSGVANVELFFDGASQGTMKKQNSTYIQTIGVSPGKHNWKAKAIDNLGNLAETPSVEFVLIVDVEPPIIWKTAVSPESPVMYEQIKVSAWIRDEISGVKQVSLCYSTDGGSKWETTSMTPQGEIYEATIPAQGSPLTIQYYVEASDSFGNLARTSTQQFAVNIPLWMYGAPVIIVIALIVAVSMVRKKLSESGGVFS